MFLFHVLSFLKKGHYSRGDIIQGRTLPKEIRQITNGRKSSNLVKSHELIYHIHQIVPSPTTVLIQRDTENDLSRFSLFFSRKFRICKPHLVSFHNRIVEQSGVQLQQQSSVQTKSGARDMIGGIYVVKTKKIAIEVWQQSSILWDWR